MPKSRSSRSARKKDKQRKRKQRDLVREQFLFSPVDSTWRTNTVDLLQLPTLLENENQSDQVIAASALGKPIAFRKITGDGNCFFRCVSYAITKKEVYYHEIRLSVCEYLRTHPQELKTFLPVEAKESVTDYLQMSQMENDYTWASEVEIFATAMLLQATIYIYTQHGVHWTWMRHSSINITGDKAIYLLHKDLNHFDIILGVENGQTTLDLEHDPNYYDDKQFKENIMKKRQVQHNVSKVKKYKKNTEFRKKKITAVKASQKRKYDSDSVYKKKLQSLSRTTSRIKYSKSEVYKQQKQINSLMRYCTNSVVRHKLIQLSKTKYMEDKIHAEKVKQYSKRKYADNSEHKEKVKQYLKSKYAKNRDHKEKVKRCSKTKYADNSDHKENVKQYSKSKYADNSDHKEKVKRYSKSKYADNRDHKEKVKRYSKSKYADNRDHKEKVKRYSKTKYADNRDHKEKVKRYSKTKYADNRDHKEKVKRYSKTKYADNRDHKEKVKRYSKTKYADNSKHKVKVKRYSKTKYAENPEHKEKLKQYSKRKYMENGDHQQKLKQCSKRKYAENRIFREKLKQYSIKKYHENELHRRNVRQYSSFKYRTFASFRNNLKASSIKKYSKNPLFKKTIKENLKRKYKQDTKLQQVKKRRVQILRQSLPKCLRNFKKHINESMQYVCTVCIRVLFRSQVKLCNRGKYMNNGHLEEMAQKCLTGRYIHNCKENDCNQDCAFKEAQKDTEWICHTCDRYLKSGQMPPQAQANDLYLLEVPPVLKALNVLERQLISIRIPFMKLLSLPRGGQKGVKGPVVNVPSDLTTVTNSLPRNVEDAQLVKVKLKRKLSYKGHYKYQWIDPVKVLKAVEYLIEKNSWYHNITLNDTWLDSVQDSELVKSAENNSNNDLMDSENDSDEELNDNVRSNKGQTFSNENHSATTSTNKDINNSNIVPEETCFQPIDIGQNMLDNNDRILCLAPAENQKPQNIFQETGSDAMAFPVLLPDGQFGLFHKRPVKLSPAKYFNARLFSADNRFANDKEFIFFAQYVTEINYISSNISIAMRKGKKTTEDGKTVTASMLLNSENLGDILKSDIGYRFLQPVRGTPPYWQRTLKDLYSMIRQLGIPTWFITFSAAEMRWEEVIKTLLLLNNDDRHPSDLEWSEKSKLVSENPVTCARMFDHRVKALFSDLILSPSSPIGKVVDFFYRTEFQQRGSPHIHCLFWIKDAPKLNHNTDEEVCNFIDQYVTCRMPHENADPELHEIISTVQTHSKSHSKSCKKYSTTCRFHFPRPPVKATFICKPRSEETQSDSMVAKVPTAEELDEISKKAAKSPKQILQSVWSLLSNDQLNLAFEDILGLAGVTYSDFKQSLEDIATKTVIYLQRKQSELWVNNYNETLIRAWNANIDIQYVTDSYACVAYILSYISKAESELGDLLQNAKEEADQGNNDVITSKRKIGSAYLQNREISSQEAVYRVCSLHLKNCSRDVVFIPAGSNILKMSLPVSVVKSKRNENDENIWMSSIHDKYYARPHHLEFDDLSLSEFCSHYRIIPQSQKPNSKKDIVYELANNFGFIKKRKTGKEAVIRYPRFNINKNPEDYYLSMIQLYLPHREAIALPDNTHSYAEYVQTGLIDGIKIQDIIMKNRSKFEIDPETLDKAWQDLQDGVIGNESWSDIAPEAEVERLEIEMEKQPNDVDEQDEIPELNFADSDRSKRDHMFEYKAPIFPKEEIQQALRNMNPMQQQVFNAIKHWCLETTWKQHPDPFQVFLTGGAGTGKSHLIKCIFYEATRILSKCTASPDSASVLLTAPTGTAAFNIGGLTIHSAFSISKKIKLPYQPLGENLLNTLRTKFDNLHLLIIDEISMVDQKLLSYIHGRLCQIMHSKKPFGNVSILAVGDFYQLPPVRALALYKPRKTDFLDLWSTHFKRVTLTEVMRQKDDSFFAEMLNRIRIHQRGNQLLDADKQALLNASCNELPSNDKDILHIFATNKQVDHHNDEMIAVKCNPIFTSMAKDFFRDKSSGKVVEKQQPIATCTQEDLQTSIPLGVGARVMLTRNIDTEDGLVNGAFGTITCIHQSKTKQITAVDVKFDNPKIGLKHMKMSKSTAQRGTVKIKPVEEQLVGRNITRQQYPLKLGWAATIHKVQGMTTSDIVVSLKHVFAPGMAYVALSRATSLKGLRVLDFDPNTIYSSDDITQALEKMPDFLSGDKSVAATNTFSIIYHNTEGLIPHFEDISHMRQFQHADVICFTETWLQQKQIPASFLPQYQHYSLLRKDAYDPQISQFTQLASMNRGGVAMFNQTSHLHSPVTFSAQNLEVIACVFQKPLHVLIVNVYRPPSYPVKVFVKNFSQLLQEIEHLHVSSLIVGDFNDNIIGCEQNSILCMLSKYGYQQLVNFPTTESGSCIDLVFTKGLQQTPDVHMIPTHYSFHEAIKITITL